MLPKKILFCADFSVNSIPAGQLAVDYAKAFRAELLIIHVIDATGFLSHVGEKGGESSSRIFLSLQE
jgi:universal stress protein A